MSDLTEQLYNCADDYLGELTCEAADEICRLRAMVDIGHKQERGLNVRIERLQSLIYTYVDVMVVAPDDIDEILHIGANIQALSQ